MLKGEKFESWEDVIKYFQFSGISDLYFYEFLDEYFEPPKRKQDVKEQ